MNEPMLSSSLFVQDWWLEAVAPDAWHVAAVEEDGRVIARLPYILRRHRGHTLMDMPLLTPHFKETVT